MQSFEKCINHLIGGCYYRYFTAIFFGLRTTNEQNYLFKAQLIASYLRLWAASSGWDVCSSVIFSSGLQRWGQGAWESIDSSVFFLAKYIHTKTNTVHCLLQTTWIPKLKIMPKAMTIHNLLSISENDAMIT